MDPTFQSLNLHIDVTLRARIWFTVFGLFEQTFTGILSHILILKSTSEVVHFAEEPESCRRTPHLGVFHAEVVLRLSSLPLKRRPARGPAANQEPRRTTSHWIGRIQGSTSWRGPDSLQKTGADGIKALILQPSLGLRRAVECVGQWGWA